MENNSIIDSSYIINNMKKTLIKVYRLRSFHMISYIDSFNMPMKFKLDCEYKNYLFQFKFQIFDYQYSSKKNLETIIEEKTNDYLKTIVKLTKTRNYINLYGEDFYHIIQKKWLNRKLNRKLKPKLKNKVIKI